MTGNHSRQLFFTPEGVGAESSLVVAGQSAGPLVPCHHVLQRCLLDHIKTDAHTSSALHVIDVLRLEDGVHRQALQVQLNADLKKQRDHYHQKQFQSGSLRHKLGLVWAPVE